MASCAKTALCQMPIDEAGYCLLEAVYVAPCSPRGPEDGRNVGETALYMRPDADVFAEPSPIAKVYVRRLEGGFAIQLPAGEMPSRYLGRPVEGSLPVIALE